MKVTLIVAALSPLLAYAAVNVSRLQRESWDAIFAIFQSIPVGFDSDAVGRVLDVESQWIPHVQTVVEVTSTPVYLNGISSINEKIAALHPRVKLLSKTRLSWVHLDCDGLRILLVLESILETLFSSDTYATLPESTFQQFLDGAKDMATFSPEDFINIEDRFPLNTELRLTNEARINQAGAHYIVLATRILARTELECNVMIEDLIAWTVLRPSTQRFIFELALTALESSVPFNPHISRAEMHAYEWLSHPNWHLLLPDAHASVVGMDLDTVVQGLRTLPGYERATASFARISTVPALAELFLRKKLGNFIEHVYDINSINWTVRHILPAIQALPDRHLSVWMEPDTSASRSALTAIYSPLDSAAIINPSLSFEEINAIIRPLYRCQDFINRIVSIWADLQSTLDSISSRRMDLQQYRQHEGVSPCPHMRQVITEEEAVILRLEASVLPSVG